MKDSPARQRAATRRALSGCWMLCLAAPALAQTIPVTTPRLAPRPATGVAVTPGAPAMSGATSPGPPSVTYPSQQPVASTGAMAYPVQQPYATAPAPVAVVVPQRAEAGACRVQPSPDRQTLVLVSGSEALARHHLALGEFRAQQVVHSPDGRWAVAFTKLRGAAQFAALTIDLEHCESLSVIPIAAAGDDARFDGDDVVLVVGGKERRVKLGNRSVR